MIIKWVPTFCLYFLVKLLGDLPYDVAVVRKNSVFLWVQTWVLNPRKLIFFHFIEIWVIY